jgi:rhamnosyltransferase
MNGECKPVDEGVVVAVAILLATYNGARFVAEQIESLTRNKTPFTLHWLDDHSSDNTVEVVRATARRFNIELREWHQPKHQGIPGGYFQLLECVVADIYLFCDQDDCWQPGKIDATVANLLPELAAPVLCFSDPLMFLHGRPQFTRRASKILKLGRHPEAMEESRVFMAFPSFGSTQGFTRSLREFLLRHAGIARAYAHMHDCWMYLLAVAVGTARLLPDAPTTLHRRHGNNFTDHRQLLGARGWLLREWRLMQRLFRPTLARQAAGFILAAPTLPQSPRLERLLGIAALVATLDRQQSPATVVRLAHRRALWPSARHSLLLAMACLCSSAPDPRAGASPH